MTASTLVLVFIAEVIMIVRDKPNAFQLFFILHGSIVPRIFPQIAFISLLGVSQINGKSTWLLPS